MLFLSCLSQCSVAVLPLLEESNNSDELLPKSELKIETMRSSGAGGQSVRQSSVLSIVFL